jgi:hypothetical protein
MMDEFMDFQIAKIDTKAPIFELSAYNPLKDEETTISLE